MAQPAAGLRPAQILGLAALGTLAVVVAIMAPDLWRFLPLPIRVRPVESALLGIGVGYEILAAIDRRRAKAGGAEAAAGRLRSALDRLASLLDPGRLAVVVGVGLAGLILAWAPQYLTWPWCRDEDAFAMLARSWDLGVLPYRDIRSYNFPGHTYLHWLLGKGIGWGRPTTFYAVDAAAVVALGVAMAAWSRRRLGLALPGLLGYAGFLWFYLGLEYEQVAERDWHASLIAALGLMAAEAWPGRGGRIASAVAFAVALSIRPHAVLFLPAMASALVEGRPGPAEPLARRLAGWALPFAATLLLVFAPVLLSGLADDLLRGIRIAAYDGPYSRANLADALRIFREQFRSPWTSGVALACLGMAVAGPPAWRGLARTWTLALLGALAYRPLHPVQHAYLAHPGEVFQAVASTLPMAWLLSTPRLGRPTRLIAALILLGEALPGVPRFCIPLESVRALGPLARGEAPPLAPLGPQRFFHRYEPCTDNYCWGDYCEALDYIRRQTSPETEVANVLRCIPFPSVNGPTGRPSPFLAESGICWMWLVNEDLDAKFAEELERSPRSVVVWDPGVPHPERRLALPRLCETIRRLYRPEARFGAIEVWRRVPDPPLDAAARP